MNANARAGKLGKCLAALMLAAMPMGAAHAVGVIEQTATANLADAPGEAAQSEPADCPSVESETAASDASPEACPEPASGGGGGMEQVPRWKTLLPGALR